MTEESYFTSQKGQDSFCHSICTGSGVHPVQWMPGSWFTWIKQPEHEATSSPNVKNSWCYNCTSPYAFMTWFLIKQTSNFICTVKPIYGVPFEWDFTISWIFESAHICTLLVTV
jgi:hypothetical protein